MLTPLNVVALALTAVVLLVGAAATRACWQVARDRRADRAHRAAGEAAVRAFAATLTDEAAIRTIRDGHMETPDQHAARMDREGQ